MRNTKTLLAALAVAGASFAGGAASAQALADAKVAVVDVERVMGQCTACVAANTQLQAQRTALQQFAQQQGTPLQSEQTSLETAVRAAAGKPDAALQTRIQAFQTKAQQAQQQVSQREQTFQRNVQYVQQQILTRMGPIVQQVAQQRGATIAVSKESTLFSATSVEITDAVLTALNAQLPSVSVTAPPPAQPAAPAATPARPPAGTGR